MRCCWALMTFSVCKMVLSKYVEDIIKIFDYSNHGYEVCSMPNTTQTRNQYTHMLGLTVNM